MPELPEVETVKRGLERAIVGATITGVDATVETLRTAVDLDSLRDVCIGQTVVALRRRAKFIVVVFGNARGLLLHLGMTGAFRVVPQTSPLGDYDRVMWTFADGRQWRFMDVRRFGSVQVCLTDVSKADPPAISHVGPEPLDDDFNADYLYAVCRGRSRPIKNLLMDQQMVVGVGNIYANEALFRARINPKRPSARVGRASCARLVSCVKSVLREAIHVGGTTISDFKGVTGQEGKFRTQLNVYGKPDAPCPRCGDRSRVRRAVQAGRSSFYCSRCQR
jgi:formamidopyrimidine-DNA glycosylase